MSLLKLPVDLLEELFDREELMSSDFKNLRLAAPALNDALSSRLFQTFTLDLDNPACLELLVGPHQELKKIANSKEAPGQVEVINGEIVIESDERDEEEAEESAEAVRDSSGAETAGSAALPEDGADRAVDFWQIGKHVRDLKVEGTKYMASKFPVSRAKLLDTGLAPFVSQLPNLRSITANLTDRAIITKSWAKLLESICPPNDDREQEGEGEKTWALHLRIDGRMDNGDDDEIYRNMPPLRNLTALQVRASLRFGEENKRRRIDAALAGIAAAVANSPTLHTLGVGLGYSSEFPFDDLLSRIPGEGPLPMVRLDMDNTEGPARLENVKRLANVRILSLREPYPHPDDDNTPQPPSVHENCSSKGDGADGACMWMQLKRCGIPLSSVKAHEICPGFISYLRDPTLVGVLKSVHLSGVAAKSSQQADDYATQFWSAIAPHGGHIERLDVDPSYYGEYCWRPNSAASDALSKLSGLKELAMCAADEEGYQGLEFVDEFLKSLWGQRGPLRDVHLRIATPNGERGAWCGTNGVMHMEDMREAYGKAVGGCTGAPAPGFRVHLGGGWCNRGKNVDHVWEGVEGEDGMWRMTRTQGRESFRQYGGDS